MSALRQRRFLWATTAVLLLAALFRLFALQDVPPGLSQDEVFNAGMPAYILAGNHAFFFRQAYGHEPLYHYWQIPFSLLLGDNYLAARLPAVALGLFLVALTMRWAKREFGSVTAVVTGLGLAVSWWPIIFSRLGLRPVLEPVLLLLMAWFWPKRPFVAGLFLGLSLYSYTGARVVFLIPVLLILHELLVRRRRLDPSPRLVQSGLIMLGVALLVSLPLFLTLQADPTLQQRVDQLAGPLQALQAGDPLPILKTTVATLGVFGLTGDPRWTYTLPNRPLFDPITAVFFLSGLGIALWRWRQQRYGFVLIWLLVGLIPSAVTPQAPSTVRLVGAMPVIYLLPGLAVGFLYQRWLSGAAAAQKQRRRLAFAVALLLLLALNTGRTVRDGFIRWPQAQETRLQHYQTVLLDMAGSADSLSALCGQAARAPFVLADSFYEPIDNDSFRFNLGYDAGVRWIQTGSEVAGAIVFPGGGEGACLFVPEFAAPDAALLRVANIPVDPVYRSEERPSFAIYEIPAAMPLHNLSPPVSFLGDISLVGYETLPVGEAGNFTLFTAWQVERPLGQAELALPTDLAIFVHLLDENGVQIAQHDGLDAAVGTLRSGDSFIQRHPFTVTSLPVAVRLGLYQRSDGLRWQPTGEAADFYTIPLSPVDD